MMAEKVEMKRTLLQHDLCRIQVFHMCGSMRPDNSRPDLDVQKNATQFTFARALFRCAFVCYHVTYLLPGVYYYRGRLVLSPWLATATLCYK